ncbi:hypothetical protein LJC63_12485 [Ruminococcaceae bacterium OttesenSCG-928-L11]|nr:hypothetical protein [Ruminococcaceae bacterium OttesenSCG-928-L11]
MVTQQLSDWARQNNCRYIHSENELCDVVEKRTEEGYAFGFSCEEDASKSSVAAYFGGVLGAIAASAATKRYIIKLGVDHNTWQKDCIKEIKQELKGIAIPGYTRGVFTLSMKKNSHTAETYDAMSAAAEAASAVLARYDVRMPTACVHCKQDNCDDFDTSKKSGSVLQPAHQSCVRSAMEESLTKLEARKEKEGYVLGFLAAVLGIFLGSLLSVLLYFIDVYSSILNYIFYLFIPMCAFSLYAKANGKAKWVSIPLILILTGVAVTALTLAGNYLWVNDGFTDSSVYYYLALLLTDAGLMLGVAVDWGIGLVAGLIGIIIGYRSLIKKSRKKDAMITALQSSLTSLKLDTDRSADYSREV